MTPLRGSILHAETQPVAAAAVNLAMPQQEGKKLLALTPKVVGRRLASTHKIAHRLMRRIRRPYLNLAIKPVSGSYSATC